MCGVVAAYDSVTAALIRIEHRGIRTRMQACPGGVFLGHVRLPIVGLGTEYDQPVEIDGWTVAFVGEILDFRDYDALAACDLPLVARTWANHGAAGFQKFDGFWSVVAVDPQGRICALVDYLAQKPLYYRSDRHATGIASEPDAAAALGPVTPDEVYFAAVVKWGYCPETWRTPYREVHKTLPGEYVRLERGKQPVRQIVDPLVPMRGVSPETLKLEIEAAVRRRVLSSDVPVACLVSGGLDSAIVYTLASRVGDVRAYHVENGEEAEALEVVGDRGARVASPGCVGIDRPLAVMQEPIDLGSLVPQMALSDAIGQGGGERVCLTGDGADEMFGGYSRAQRYDSQASDVQHELIAWHLPRLDRIMMRNRIEVRSPFLARRVAEIALGLPRELRTDKKALRDLFRADLPSGVADRPKRPLRTAAVERNREGNSKMLVDKFRQEKWG